MTSLASHTSSKTPRLLFGLSFDLWFLSVAGFFLNVASVIAFAVTPIFMRLQFGSNDLAIGTLEGVVEAFALIVRAFSGMVSDWIGRRKIVVLWGYGTSLLARFFLAPATIVELVIASRFTEKLGNGLQASPREAFISDITPPDKLGQAYSLNKTWSMAGSLTGGLIILYMGFLTSHRATTLWDLRALLWFGAASTLLSTLILWGLVKDYSKPTHTENKEKFSLFGKLQQIKKDFLDFPMVFWGCLAIVCLFKMGLFSGTILMARLRDVGVTFFGHTLSKNTELLSNGVFQLIQCFSSISLAYLLGSLFDRVDCRWILGVGFSFMIISLSIFAYGYQSYHMYIGIMFYGFQYSIHGSLMAWLSKAMPKHLYGTGFGVFFVTSGLSVAASNFLMRALAVRYSFETAFETICCIIFLALCLLPLTPSFKKPQA